MTQEPDPAVPPAASKAVHPDHREREFRQRIERLEEGLERLFVLAEAQRTGVKDFIETCAERDPEGLLIELEVGHWVRVADGRVAFTPPGEARARAILRRHRLAEKLLQDVFGMGEADMESGACVFEHILSEEATQRVCTFLGHPKTCPHGRSIPPGDCCKVFAARPPELPAVSPLIDLAVGSWGQIFFINPLEKRRLARLTQYGLAPNAKIRLVQRRPAIVVQLGETELALDDEIGRQIFVVPIPPGSESIEKTTDQAARGGWGFLRRILRRGR